MSRKAHPRTITTDRKIMTGKPRIRLTAAVAVASAMLLGACTSSDPDPAALAFDDTPSLTEEGTLAGQAIDGGAEVEGVRGVEEVWLAAGADPQLAECYRSVLEDAGLGGEVSSLADMAALQDSLTDEQREAFDGCVDLAN